MFISDSANQRIREVNAVTGIITTVAGNGTRGYNGDNIAATSAQLNFPTGVAVDGAGNLYIADNNNNRIRRVASSTGLITTVAGNGAAGFVDNVPATSSMLDEPFAVTLDAAGNLYIADSYNNRIRKVVAGTGIITTVAGSAGSGHNGDSIPATSAELNFPTSVELDAAGNLYIADNANHRIRKVMASTGLITTVAGNGVAGYNGDGSVSAVAELNFPRDIALDGSGNLYIADYSNQRVREVSAAAPSLSFLPTDVGRTSSDSPQTITVGNNGYDPTNTNPLTFSGVSTGTTSFVLDSTNSCTTSTSLEPGQICALAVDFTPQAPGTTLTDVVTVADNNLNHINSAASPQTVPLSGNGLQQTPVVTVATATISYGTPTVALSATMSFVGATAPTGLVTFTIDSGAPVSASCTGTTSPLTCTAIYPSSTLGVPTHTITASLIATPGFLAASGINTLTVTPALATVTANPASKTYGAANPAFSATVAGTVNGDTLNYTLATTATTASGVGLYPITVTLGLNPNYSVTPTNGTLTVGQATATVTANPATKVYGTADPILTGTLSGFLPADGITATYRRMSGETVAGSPYTISATLSPTAAVANYSITYKTAAFTITKANPVITWANPATITYGTPLSNAQLDATANVPGTFFYTAPVVGLNPAGTLLPAGTSPLGAGFTPTDTTDYNSISAYVQITVNKATTTTTIAVTTTQTVTGTTATITATVHPQIGGTPTGTVTYFSGSANLGSAAVGTPLTTGVLPVGTNQITAVYGGDSNFTGSSSSATAVTSIAPTAVTLSLGLTQVFYPTSAVSFTVIVPLKNLQLISGTITLYDETTVIGTYSLPAGGVLVGVTPQLSVGTHKLRAVYSGNAQYPPGESPIETVTVSAL